MFVRDTSLVIVIMNRAVELFMDDLVGVRVDLAAIGGGVEVEVLAVSAEGQVPLGLLLLLLAIDARLAKGSQGISTSFPDGRSCWCSRWLFGTAPSSCSSGAGSAQGRSRG